jgi:hypothetical protein
MAAGKAEGGFLAGRDQPVAGIRFDVLAIADQGFFAGEGNIMVAFRLQRRELPGDGQIAERMPAGIAEPILEIDSLTARLAIE